MLSSKALLFFFWRQISIGYFLRLFGHLIEAASQECGQSRGVRARRRARAPPPCRQPRAEGGRKGAGDGDSSGRCPRQDGGREKRGRGRQPTGVTANARGSGKGVDFSSVQASTNSDGYLLGSNPFNPPNAPSREPQSATPSPRSGQCLKLSVVPLTCRQKPAPQRWRQWLWTLRPSFP